MEDRMTPNHNDAVLHRFMGKPLIRHTARCIQQAASGDYATFSSHGVTIQPFLGSDTSEAERFEAQEFIYALKDLNYLNLHAIDRLKKLPNLQQTPRYDEVYTLTNISPHIHRVTLMVASSPLNTQQRIKVSLIEGVLTVGDYKAKIRRNSATYTIVEVLLSNIDEPHKEWSWDELTELIGEDPEGKRWRGKIYKVGYDLNAKFRHLDAPLFILTTYTLQLNPVYVVS